jgi:hypothetical protein
VGLECEKRKKWSMVEPESVFPVNVLPEIKKEINKYAKGP